MSRVATARQQRRLAVVGRRLFGEPARQVVLREQREERVLPGDHLVDAEPALLLEPAKERAPDVDEDLASATRWPAKRRHQPQDGRGKDESLAERRRRAGAPRRSRRRKRQVVHARLDVRLQRRSGHRRAAVVDVAPVVEIFLAGEPATNFRTAPLTTVSAPSGRPPRATCAPPAPRPAAPASRAAARRRPASGQLSAGRPQPRRSACEDRVHPRPHAGVAGGAAGALVDLLGDGDLDRPEDVVLEGGHLRCRAVGDEDAGLQLLAGGERDLGSCGPPPAAASPPPARAAACRAPRRKRCPACRGAAPPAPSAPRREQLASGRGTSPRWRRSPWPPRRASLRCRAASA